MKYLKFVMISVLAAVAACGGSDATNAPRPVYESIPSPIPPSLVSEAYQATATSEFGDSITLAGTARKAASAKFVMVTWATGAYTYPITLNLYRPGELVHPFATKTQQFGIPARPAADPSCSDGRWLASGRMPLRVRVPDHLRPDRGHAAGHVCVRHRAQHPVVRRPANGPGRYYNSLNIGLVSMPRPPERGSPVPCTRARAGPGRTRARARRAASGPTRAGTCTPRPSSSRTSNFRARLRFEKAGLFLGKAITRARAAA